VIAPAPWDQVGEAAEEISDREQLRRCLGQLSGPQHLAITLACCGGRIRADIAIAQGVAEGTAKTRIRDTLIKPCECMQARVK
jgi:RNA polymerase sigma-70 factor, ECF subfamily